MSEEFMALVPDMNRNPLICTNLLVPGVVPPMIGSFNFDTLNVVTFDVGALIPNTAQQITVTIVVRSGYNPKESQYNLWIWTETMNGQKDVKFKRGYRYPQPAWSSDSETLSFVYSSSHSRLYLQTDVMKNAGNMYLEIYAVSYSQ